MFSSDDADECIREGSRKPMSRRRSGPRSGRLTLAGRRFLALKGADQRRFSMNCLVPLEGRSSMLGCKTIPGGFVNVREVTNLRKQPIFTQSTLQLVLLLRQCTNYSNRYVILGVLQTESRAFVFCSRLDPEVNDAESELAHSGPFPTRRTIPSRVSASAHLPTMDLFKPTPGNYHAPQRAAQAIARRLARQGFQTSTGAREGKCNTEFPT